MIPCGFCRLVHMSLMSPHACPQHPVIIYFLFPFLFSFFNLLCRLTWKSSFVTHASFGIPRICTRLLASVPCQSRANDD